MKKLFLLTLCSISMVCAASDAEVWALTSDSQPALTQEEIKKKQNLVVLHFPDFVFSSNSGLDTAYMKAVEDSNLEKRKEIITHALNKVNIAIVTIFNPMQKNSNFTEIMTSVPGLSNVNQTALNKLSKAFTQDSQNKKEGIPSISHESLINIISTLSSAHFKKLQFISNFNKGYKSGTQEGINMVLEVYTKNLEENTNKNN